MSAVLNTLRKISEEPSKEAEPPPRENMDRMAAAIDRALSNLENVFDRLFRPHMLKPSVHVSLPHFDAMIEQTLSVETEAKKILFQTASLKNDPAIEGQRCQLKMKLHSCKYLRHQLKERAFWKRGGIPAPYGAQLPISQMVLFSRAVKGKQSRELVVRPSQLRPAQGTFVKGYIWISRSQDYFPMKVAVKQSASKTLLDEAALIVALRHIQIIQVFYIEKPSLSQHFYKLFLEPGDSDLIQIVINPQTPIARYFYDHMETYMGQMLDAVSYVHSRGLVHHDIKPDNFVMVKSWEPSGLRYRVKLVDFGVTTVIGKSESHPSGTANYLPPWYLKAHLEKKEVRASPAIDMWSLGISFATLVSRTTHALRFSGGVDAVEGGSRWFQQQVAQASETQIQSAIREVIEETLDALPSSGRRPLFQEMLELFLQNTSYSSSVSRNLQKVKKRLSKDVEPCSPHLRRRCSLSDAKEKETSPFTQAARKTASLIQKS